MRGTFCTPLLAAARALCGGYDAFLSHCRGRGITERTTPTPEHHITMIMSALGQLAVGGRFNHNKSDEPLWVNDVAISLVSAGKPFFFLVHM